MTSDMDFNSLVMNISLEYLDVPTNYSNDSAHPYENRGDASSFLLKKIILFLVTLFICWMGLLGNGTVIWLLGFQTKRNHFTTFILNLAIADFGFLLSIVPLCVNDITDLLKSVILNLVTIYFSYIMYLSSQFLLTAISVDRCLCVLFPIWHRFSRPNHLSAIVCVLLWIIAFLMGGFLNIIGDVIIFNVYDFYSLPFFVTSMVCCPLITISAVILFIKLYLKSQQQNRGRLLLIILVTLLCFLILTFPLNIFSLIDNFVDSTDASKWEDWRKSLVLCACLNSSVNPFIYFLIGRKKRGQSRESLKAVLQKAFKDDESISEG